MALAESRLRGPIKYVLNAPRTHVLCISQQHSRPPAGPGMVAAPLRFLVCDLRADRIIFEDALDNARVAWENDTRIKVVITPGMVPDVEPHQYGYRFDVLTEMREEL